MLCEIGMPWDQAENCKALISEMMTADVEGVFYWEPQAPSGYNGGYQPSTRSRNTNRASYIGERIKT